MGKAKTDWMESQHEEAMKNLLIDTFGLIEQDLVGVYYDFQLSDVDSFSPKVKFTFSDGTDPELLEMMGISPGSYEVYVDNYVDDYNDNEEIATIMGVICPLNTLVRQLDSILDLIPNPPILDKGFNLLVMLHAHTISSTEAYLSATFVQKVLSDVKYVRKVVETDPYYKKEKLSLSEIFNLKEEINTIVSNRLSSQIFHQIKTVKIMFKNTFNIDLGDIGWLGKAVSIRHDCVHRAGYTKENIRVAIDSESIKSLVHDCRKFCTVIDEKLQA